MSFSRLAVVAALLALCVASLAEAKQLINKDSMTTYRQAVVEKNHLKGSAMLRGLLVDSITIGIDKSSIEPGADDYQRPIADAMAIWNSALGQQVFKMAGAHQTPDVVVKFVPRVKDGDSVQGYVQAQRHFYWDSQTFGADIQGEIQIRDNVGNRYLVSDEVCRVMTHELGHVLGLDDDPDGPGIMSDFYSGRGIKRPSKEEVLAITDFRTLLRTALGSR